jgi:hypothetical protein
MLLKTAWVVILIDDEDTHRAVGQIGVFVFHGSVTLAHDGPILPPLVQESPDPCNDVAILPH